jgi:hypothetical protein
MTQLQAGEQPHCPQDTRAIALTQGKWAIVDAADYDWLNQWKWYAHREGRSWYAVRKVTPRPKSPILLQMHRFIIDAPCGIKVDHRDGDGLNNTRRNLRLASDSQNQWNRRASKNNTSGFIGVIWDKPRQKWRAQLNVRGRQIFVGRFNSAEDAAHARDCIAKNHHGEFAALNFRSES